MACVAVTNSINLAIAAGTLSANLILDPAVSNGLTISAAGVKAPSNTTVIQSSNTVAGTASTVAAGNSGQQGPVLLSFGITNPSADRSMTGIWIARNIGEQINWNTGSTAVCSFQSSVNSGATWNTQSQNFYANVAGINGYGSHVAIGSFGMTAGQTVPGGTLQFRMYIACTAGGGSVISTGDMDFWIFIGSE